ncbi:MAG: two-component system, OmpR family, response regulator [Chthoniobacter sp.]|nr:two-component system, OmpR family, response regulator [Chthoniobacter sp.]
MILETTGTALVCEENCGNRALETAREFRPDLIFLDWNIGDKKGGELAIEMRNDSALCSIPIVFMTGSVTREEAATERVLGDFPTLAKPFSMDELLQVAAAHLEDPKPAA